MYGYPREDALPGGPYCLTGADSGQTGYLYSDLDHQEHAGLDYAPGTGFKVSGDTGLKYLVMYTHYPILSNLTGGMTGEAAIRVKVSQGTPLKRVGLLRLGNTGLLAPRSVTSLTGSAVWWDPIPIHLFVYSVHTHSRGIGTLVWKEDSDGRKSVITDRDPHDQRWYPTDTDVEQGDKLGFKCVYNNTEDAVIEVKYESPSMQICDH